MPARAAWTEKRHKDPQGLATSEDLDRMRNSNKEPAMTANFAPRAATPNSARYKRSQA